MEKPEFRRRISFNRTEYEAVLGRMETGATAPTDEDGRRRERHEYRESDIPLIIEHPDGGTSRFLVFGRNISRNGISVLHGGFVHNGSVCRVTLGQLGGDTMTVVGEVRHCRLVAGSCHEIGIMFAEEIDPKTIAGADCATEADAGSEAAGAFHDITGEIVLAEAYEPDRQLLEHQLVMLGLTVNTVVTPGAVIDATRRGQVDLVLLGLPLAGGEAAKTIASSRETGYRGPILVMTAETNAELLDGVRKAGATDIVGKPYYLDLLVAQLRVHLGAGGPSTQQFSTVSDQSGMPPLISKYVQIVRRTADQIDKAYQEEAWDRLRDYCCQLKGSGCGYGFQNITVAALAALTALDEGPTEDAASEAITALVACCRALEFAAPATATA